uniref:Putative endodeoxyribonuclease n=1 Tax=viral metagenome TaxID=1070528 RepID=A0A6M3JG60_9ZZZZ
MARKRVGAHRWRAVIYHFEVVAHPQGKERPRTVRSRRGKVFTYTPKRTKDYEHLVQACFLELYQRKLNDAESNWSLDVDVYYKGRCMDADNVAKSIMDALNGFIWHDDSQVVELRVRMHKADKNECQRVIIQACPLKEWR